jgi:hypothetical protein
MNLKMIFEIESQLQGTLSNNNGIEIFQSLMNILLLFDELSSLINNNVIIIIVT